MFLYYFLIFQIEFKKTVKIGQTYKQLWDKSFPWLSPVKANKHLSYCNLCKAESRVDGNGRSQVVAHVASKKHGTLAENSKDQR